MKREAPNANRDDANLEKREKMLIESTGEHSQQPDGSTEKICMEAYFKNISQTKITAYIAGLFSQSLKALNLSAHFSEHNLLKQFKSEAKLFDQLKTQPQNFNSRRPISFTQLDKRSRQTVIVLLCRYKVQKICHHVKPVYRMRIQFMSESMRVLHVHHFSNDPESIKRLQEFIKKRFSKLSELVIIHEVRPILSDKPILLSLLNCCQNTILMGLQLKGRVLPKKTLNFEAQQYDKFGENKQIASQQENQIEYKNGNIFKRYNFDGFAVYSRQKISKKKPVSEKYQIIVQEVRTRHQHILSLLTPQKDKKLQNIFIENDICCRVYAFYFHLLSNKNLLLEMNQKKVHHEALQLIFESTMSQEEQQDSIQKDMQFKCFPISDQDNTKTRTKRCIVCQTAKSIYRCQNCSKKYNQPIHLCLHDCFAMFHEEKVKYLSKFKGMKKQALMQKPQFQALIQEKQSQSMHDQQHFGDKVKLEYQCKIEEQEQKQSEPLQLPERHRVTRSSEKKQNALSVDEKLKKTGQQIINSFVTKRAQPQGQKEQTSLFDENVIQMLQSSPLKQQSRRKKIKRNSQNLSKVEGTVKIQERMSEYESQSDSSDSL